MKIELPEGFSSWADYARRRGLDYPSLQAVLYKGRGKFGFGLTGKCVRALKKDGIDIFFLRMAESVHQMMEEGE